MKIMKKTFIYTTAMLSLTGAVFGTGLCIKNIIRTQYNNNSSAIDKMIAVPFMCLGGILSGILIGAVGLPFLTFTAPISIPIIRYMEPEKVNKNAYYPLSEIIESIVDQ